MVSGVKKTVDNLPKLKANLAKMTARAVFVGVPSETTNIREDMSNVGPINNATIAYLMQNGSPAQNIPARPFMTIGMDGAKEPATKQLENAAKRMLKSNDSAEIERGLGLAGQVAENYIKNAINSNIQPALSEATLKARARRGRKGAMQELANRAAGMEPNEGGDLAKTLVDTGALRNSIRYVIREDK
jgi:hypothetical protein